MTVEDARSILAGPEDAATRCFRAHAGERLAAAIRPLVARATAEAGVTAAYERLLETLGPVARMTTPGSGDLDGCVTGRAAGGVCVKLAGEQRRIREDPLARSTEPLRRVLSTSR